MSLDSSMDTTTYMNFSLRVLRIFSTTLESVMVSPLLLIWLVIANTRMKYSSTLSLSFISTTSKSLLNFCSSDLFTRALPPYFAFIESQMILEVLLSKICSNVTLSMLW
uniref:Uncharacterized protein n=1 Tax=Brassica oleracea var. oleracea TaxID=109376 RepID=A0A0D3BAG2_BRAOL